MGEVSGTGCKGAHRATWQREEASIGHAEDQHELRQGEGGADRSEETCEQRGFGGRSKGPKNGWDEQDIKAALDQHNALRARHGASPLQWSDALAQDAQKAANQCVEKGMLHHSNHAGAGQNGAWGFRSFKDSIDGWYSEISDYDFD